MNKLSDYKEIRGTLVRKRSTVFGNHYLYISDGTDAVSVMIGKAAYDLYTVGMRLTVGCADHKIINIRPGIVENEDQFLSFPFVCDEDKDDHTEQKGVLL